ncbi:hypothetical protein DYB36_003734 [Aphanomyces astaci]|uniref:Cilia- and flagella-associated protein 300 n=1 Tax=Aphanomyces astaci TaxID=112090 RepID=A0A397AT48_APHAT|nr:hypothetical protein DYB36_003734 [Aphanomyces astaci]
MSVLDKGTRYSFECIPHKPSQWETTEMKLKLMQWYQLPPCNNTGHHQGRNLDQHGGVKRFRMRGKFDPANDAAFLRAFFESKSVRANLPFPATMPASLDDLSFRKLKTNVSSMAFFDKLEACPDIVSCGGMLRRCMDDVVDDCTVNDNLRDMLVNPHSDHASSLFSSSEQDEAIFQIFKRLAIGGAMAQHDDTLQPYLDCTKQVYKALLSVHKATLSHHHHSENAADPLAKTQIGVRTSLYMVHTGERDSNQQEMVVSNATRQLFPKPNSPFNACFVAIDPHTFTVLCWYVPFVPFW